VTNARSRKGPPPSHSRDEIAGVAVGIADRDGLAAVTIRRVAAELGTAGAALYRYVSGRDDLVGLMVDRVTAEIPLVRVPRADWVDEVIALADDLRAVYRRHPWLADLPGRTIKPGPNLLAYFEFAVTLLEPVPVPLQAKMEAVAMVTGIVTLFTRQESAPQPFDADAPTLGSPAVPRADLFHRVLRGVLHGVLD
jgi:AcrR family transcriptional regulator